MIFLLMLLSISGELWAQVPGALDTSFAASRAVFVNEGRINNQVNTAVFQAGGKILLGGNFSGFNQSRYTRINFDGREDFTYSTEFGFANGSVQAIVPLTNHKVLIGGKFSEYRRATVNNLVRLDSEGNLDPAFNLGLGFEASSRVNTLVPLADGKILVGGDFKEFNGEAVDGILRLHPDGSRDESFLNPSIGMDNQISALAVQADGKILLGVDYSHSEGEKTYRIIRLMENGNLDQEFNDRVGFLDGLVRTIAVQADGKIILGGSFGSIQSTNTSPLIRLHRDGSLDTNFTPLIENGEVFTLAIQENEKLLAGGSFTQVDGKSYNRIARFEANGSLDPRFDPQSGFDELVRSIRVGENGQILIGGNFNTYQGSVQPYFTLIQSDGSPFPGPQNIEFNGSQPIRSLNQEADGKILVYGDFASIKGVARRGLARLALDGAVDMDFDPAASLDFFLSGLLLQPDGKFLTEGFNQVERKYEIVRFFPDGSPDPGFSLDRPAVGRGLWDTQYGGEILLTSTEQVNGLDYSGQIRRLFGDGRFDPSLQASLYNFDIIFFNDITSQIDDKILVGGAFRFFNDEENGGFVRAHPDGRTDKTFKLGTGISGGVVESIVIQPDGKILLGGNFKTYNGIPRAGILRLHPDGRLDEEFDPGAGIGGAFGRVYVIELQDNGKILVGGFFDKFDGKAQGSLIRLHPDGSLDTSFDIGSGFRGSVRALEVQRDGKILVGGDFDGFNGEELIWLARLHGDQTDPSLGISEVRLINAQSNEVIGPLEDFPEIILSDYKNQQGTSLFSIQAKPNNNRVKSIKFDIQGPVNFSQVENWVPYAIFGDDFGDFNGRELLPGNYELTLTPFSETKGRGQSGEVKKFRFRVRAPQVQLIELIDAVQDTVVFELTDSLEVDVTALNNRFFSIQAIVNDFSKSVKMEIQGPINDQRIENIVPYALFGDTLDMDFFGQEFLPGNYTVIITPYSEKRGQGSAGEPYVIHFRVFAEAFGIAEALLLNPISKEVIGNLEDNAVINLDDYEDMQGSKQFTIQAIPNKDQLNGVQFEMSGPIEVNRTEVDAPYTLFGDQGVINGRDFLPGDYTLTITPIPSVDADTNDVQALVQNFQVVVDSVARVRDISLLSADVNASSEDPFILKLKDGIVIDLIDSPIGRFENLTLLANASGFTQSVFLELEGPVSATRTESRLPFTLFGESINSFDGNIDYFGAELPPGEYTISVTPYSENNLKGIKGETLTYNFTLLNTGFRSASATLKQAGTQEGKAQVSLVSPNPLQGKEITLQFSKALDSQVSYQIFDAQGKILREGQKNVRGKEMRIQFIEGLLPKKAYYLRVSGEDLEADSIQLIR